MSKFFLDVEGLALYDQLMKDYIQKAISEDSATQEQIINDLVQFKDEADAKLTALESFKNETESILLNLATFKDSTESRLTEISTFEEETTQKVSEMEETLNTLNQLAQSNSAAIEIINGTGEGSIDKKVSDAIAKLVDNAPETFDTLKELSDWIENNEAESAVLIGKVNSNEQAIQSANEEIESAKTSIEEIKTSMGGFANKDEIKSYVDTQDESYYNSINSIYSLSIESLFKTKVLLQENQSVSEAITALQEDEILVLSENMIVSEDLNIPANVVIDGNGATFSGNVIISKAATIENATFTGPVTVSE